MCGEKKVRIPEGSNEKLIHLSENVYNDLSSFNYEQQNEFLKLLKDMLQKFRYSQVEGLKKELEQAQEIAESL